jgi:dipeptidyl aminopeptidase/acylaminoacyl peptidase
VATPVPAAAVATATASAISPPAALRTEGLPPLSVTLMAQTQRYNQVAGHAFVDWHPSQREMLVLHRPPGASTAQLFRLRSPGGTLEPLTSGADRVAGARWEPREGRYIVFGRDTGGNEAYQLFRLDPDTRATTQITPADQRHSLLGWVKSRSLALVSSVPLDKTAAAGSRTEITTTVSLVDPLKPATRRTLVELPGGGWFGGEVAPDEKQLAMTRYVSATESEVWLIDLATGQRRRVLPAPGEPQWASHHAGGWSADGKALFFGSDRAGEFTEVMRLDIARGTLTRLTAQTPWDAHLGSLSSDGSTAAVVVNVDGRSELRLLDSVTGAARSQPSLAGLPPGSVTRGEFHPKLAEVALVVNSTQAPSEIHSLDVASGRVVAWTRAVGTEGLNLHTLPPQQIVRWKSFDGRVISGVLSLPPARFVGPRPVVMVMHGGPEGQSHQGWNGRLNYLIEQLGVAVLEPNVRGSSGYGKTFISLDNGRLREDSVKDMGTAIDWIATQPNLDATRVLVMGGSYGGYMALAASTRLADRIAGAAATVGISNFVSFLENTESYRRDLRRVEYGDERDPAMRAFLQEISPLTHADKITKPLMVVQGRNDPRVPWTESEQIVRSLQSRGTPVWYLLANNEGHGFARRENSDFYFAALVKFVEQTLKP